ncbi:MULTISPECIES: SDR family NAD(P)-dependent oxidoreductase [Staphylococcus]|uniref:SDR family oxidoreductase n=1 Tax=Staphylococcus equorum TaxID=246432 RepID=A0A9X4R5R3_9STAP|nr:MULTISPECIES: SDR family NAD(P)-dependent oxidoreductase [Staphylococcus]KRG11357.1 short-chain dehydrogenase [Staphylococcus sp. NAM3COL9]MDG0844399.1 SDR family oxidoreductase [Staphylococcus equorum]MDG0860608.1 SDR family oxidoreductase [Staphylococcus equorum]
MKTIVIVGAGTGLGLSLAKKFGAEGFRVAAISRNAEKLKVIQEDLSNLNIEAKTFIADITDLELLKQSIQTIKVEFGSIDIIEFSPYAKEDKFTNILETTPESVSEMLKTYLFPSIQLVNEILPDMINKGSGSILFTTGVSTIFPLPFAGNAGIIGAGLRNYAENLYNEMEEKGIFIRHLSIGTVIESGTMGDPDSIAKAWYNLYNKKGKFEETFPQDLKQSDMF